MNRKRILKTLQKWSSNAYRSIRWDELVSLLESLEFEVKPKNGTVYLISHRVLATITPDFSPCGGFLVDKPHRKGDPVDPGALKKKIIPAIEMILDYQDTEEDRETND